MLGTLLFQEGPSVAVLLFVCRWLSLARLGLLVFIYPGKTLAMSTRLSFFFFFFFFFIVIYLIFYVFALMH